MRNWQDFKDEAKRISPNVKQNIEEMETLASIVSIIIEKRTSLGISQRDLANICGLPQSSIARIEAYTVSPKAETLIKIMKPLGLTLTATQISINE